jgi:hypothetical protein
VDYPLTVIGGTVVDVRVSPSPTVAISLTGTVRDAATGRGIGNAEVESAQGVNVGRGTRTDANGTYRLDQLNAGSMQVRASVDGYESQTIAVTVAGSQELNFALTAKSTFTFVVAVNDGRGAPVPGAQILTSEEGTITTDANGRVEMRSAHNSLHVTAVRGPSGYETVFNLPDGGAITLVAGQNTLRVRRVVSVIISAQSSIPRSDGTMRVAVRATVTFDTGENKTLTGRDFVTLATSNPAVVRVGGADGSNLYVEGLSPGTASVTGQYAEVTSAPVTVEVRP